MYECKYEYKFPFNGKDYLIKIIKFSQVPFVYLNEIYADGKFQYMFGPYVFPYSLAKIFGYPGIYEVEAKSEMSRIKGKGRG